MIDLPDEDIENFNILNLAKEGQNTLLEMVLPHLSIYNFHVDSRDDEGNTLLHLITGGSGESKMVQKLLNLGASVNVENNMKETPLYLACLKGNLEVVKLLVNNSANLHVKDSKSRSLLHLSVELNNLELCKYLIDCGINVNSQDHNGSTPLHYAISLKLSKVTFLLVHNKGDVNKQDYDGYTPLHIAAKTSTDLLKFLLRNKAISRRKTFNGDLALHLAASSGNLAAVTVLLNGEFKLNDLNKDNYTPLQLAEINGYEKVVQFLSGNSESSTSFVLTSKIPRAARKPQRTNVNSSSKKIFSLPRNRPTISL